MDNERERSGRAAPRVVRDRVKLKKQLRRAARVSSWIEVVGLPGVGKSSLVQSALPTREVFGFDELSPTELDGLLQRKDAKKLCVIVDDVPDDPPTATLRQLERWRRRAGAAIVTIGRTPHASRHEIPSTVWWLHPFEPAPPWPETGHGASLAAELLAARSGCPMSPDIVDIARLAEGIPLVLELLSAAIGLRGLESIATLGLEAIEEPLREAYARWLPTVASEPTLDALTTTWGSATVDDLTTAHGVSSSGLALLRLLGGVAAHERPGAAHTIRLIEPLRVAWQAHRSERGRRPLQRHVQRCADRLAATACEALGPALVGPRHDLRARLVPLAEAMDAHLRESWSRGEGRWMVATVRGSLSAAGVHCPPDTYAALDEAIAQAPERLAARAAIGRAHARWHDGQTHSAVEDLQRARALTSDAVLYTLASVHLAHLLAEAGEVDAARVVFDETRNDTGHVEVDGQWWGTSARIDEIAGDFDTAGRALLEQRRIALDAGDMWQVAMADVNRARRVLVRDAERRCEALALYEAAVSRFDRVDPFAAYVFRGTLAGFYLGHGDARQADRQLRRLPRIPRSPLRFAVTFEAYRCVALNELGKRDQAWACLAAAEQRIMRIEDDMVRRCLRRARQLLEGQLIDASSPSIAADDAPLIALALLHLRRGGERTRVAANGDFFINCAGARVDLSKRQASKRLVARMVASLGESVPKSALIAAAWPSEGAPASMRVHRRLRTTISNLRKLGLAAIDTTEDGYALDAVAIAVEPAPR